MVTKMKWHGWHFLEGADGGHTECVKVVRLTQSVSVSHLCLCCGRPSEQRLFLHLWPGKKEEVNYSFRTMACLHKQGLVLKGPRRATWRALSNAELDWQVVFGRSSLESETQQSILGMRCCESQKHTWLTAWLHTNDDTRDSMYTIAFLWRND